MSSAGPILNSISTIAQAAGQTLVPAVRTPRAVWDALSIVSKLAGNEVGGVPLETFGDLKELIELQIQMQKEMQAVTMVSNIEKTKHESRMAAVRNIRTS